MQIFGISFQRIIYGGNLLANILHMRNASESNTPQKINWKHYSIDISIQMNK